MIIKDKNLQRYAVANYGLKFLKIYLQPPVSYDTDDRPLTQRYGGSHGRSHGVSHRRIAHSGKQALPLFDMKRLNRPREICAAIGDDNCLVIQHFRQCPDKDIGIHKRLPFVPLGQYRWILSHPAKRLLFPILPFRKFGLFELLESYALRR